MLEAGGFDIWGGCVSELIQGLAERFGVAELGVMLEQALTELANGVRVTSVTLDGGGGSGTPLAMDPERMVGILRKAIAARREIDGATGEEGKYFNEQPSGHQMNFSARAART